MKSFKSIARKRPTIVKALGVCAIAVALSSCSSNGASDASNHGANADPRKGTVEIGSYETNSFAFKRCDGTTLVYYIDRGGSAIPNSPECAG